MFKNALLFNRPLDGWNVSQVQDISKMFFNAVAFNQNLCMWNVCEVSNMSSFYQPLDNLVNSYLSTRELW